jgi:hypothetical protein
MLRDDANEAIRRARLGLPSPERREELLRDFQARDPAAYEAACWRLAKKLAAFHRANPHLTVFEVPDAYLDCALAEREKNHAS